MNPVFLHIGSLEIRWYGMMIALGVLATYWLQVWRSKRYGVNADNIADITFWGLVAGIIGARTLYVIRFWDEYFADGNLLEIIAVWHGGLVFQGGFIAGFIAVIVYAKIKKLDIGAIGDLLAAALPAGHAFGRIGCLLNKCCYGFQPYEGFCAIHYEKGAAGYFPVQGVECLGNLLICGAVLLLERFGVAKRRLFIIYMMAYTVLRFCDEFLRGDYPEEQVHAGLTPAQVICLWLLPVLGLAYVAVTWYNKKEKKD
ncbi:MAG: prolipoprotein diacylglyceryl transferase [Lentisphaeria bacterium]|nr:prolipoprotein diacylglyceryl transferase [Lentisphaeria bacterium]